MVRNRDRNRHEKAHKAGWKELDDVEMDANTSKPFLSKKAFLHEKRTLERKIHTFEKRKRKQEQEQREDDEMG